MTIKWRDSIFSQWWITAKNTAFLVVTTCSSVGLYRCFGGYWLLQFQVQVPCFFFTSFWWRLIFSRKKKRVMHFINVQWIDIFFFFWRNIPQWAMASSFTRFLCHTQTHHTRSESSGRVIRLSQRPLCDKTHHSQETDFHAPRDSNPQSQQGFDVTATGIFPQICTRCHIVIVIKSGSKWLKRQVGIMAKIWNE
jgi:hypothetical protein